MKTAQMIYTVSNGEHTDLYSDSELAKVIECLESDQSLTIKTYQLNQESYGVTESGKNVSEYLHQDDSYLVIFEPRNVRFIYDQEYVVYEEGSND